MDDSKFMDTLIDAIDRAFGTHFNKDEGEPQATPKNEKKTAAIYESIEDFTAQTGKRFRMTKRQKELGMTREEAFNLTYGDN